jgi:hypothetical protein
MRLLQLVTVILLMLASLAAAASVPTSYARTLGGAPEINYAGDAPCHQHQSQPVKDDGGCDPQMICAMLCGALPAAAADVAVGADFTIIRFGVSDEFRKGATAKPDAPPPRALLL